MNRAALEARLAEIAEQMQAIVAGAETRGSDLTDDENGQIDQLIADNEEVRGKLAKLDADEERARKASAIAGTLVPAAARTEERSEPFAKGGQDSYFRTLFRAKVQGERRAFELLEKNDRYVADKGTPEQRAMSTTPGAGGEFAPPLWQVDDFVAYLRPGRPLADILNKSTLPSGVSSINLPKVTTGALTGLQSTQNTAVANRDFATGSVSTGISTIAGQVVISQQDLDQSPVNLDEIILQDMANDYAYQIDLATVAAVVAAAGNVITYTNASPTSAGLIAQTQVGIDAIHTGVFRPATAIVMRPDRWGRMLSAVDGNGRPLVLPIAEYGAYNVQGLGEGQTPMGVAGTLRGVPVILDPSIPNNLGAGTNQDEILVLRPQEINLYESAPKAEVFQQTYANQLSVLCRFYAYYGIIANRLPKAISTIVGTGLVPQSYGV